VCIAEINDKKERWNWFVIGLSMNPKSYVVTWTPHSNKHSLKHRLDLDISIAKDIRIRVHGWLDYKLIWSLDINYKIVFSKIPNYFIEKSVMINKSDLDVVFFFKVIIIMIIKLLNINYNNVICFFNQLKVYWNIS
jgi:hypothetical protein